ncbi:hypothetical protein [Agriterribacter sp.]|uniref:hypothetical protein n=1 Tax=Agriterribacter sp. TaxID=2821509 RepID=UPI002CFDD803|nr:hypothetical protein [Agriterribacter sp.]HTN05146.1 hypothetical protein [Agriterribacter sp.]
MHYYIIVKEIEYCIMKVRPDDRESFEKHYQGKILFEAESIAELLVKFSEKLNDKTLSRMN